jgi:hypothetical protein
MTFSRGRWFGLLTLAILVIATVGLSACNCGQRRNGPGKGGGERALRGPNAKSLLPANLDEQTKQKCKTVCTDVCKRGQECKAPGFGRPERCGKVCFVLCANGVIDDPTAACMAPENECPQVKKCLGDLATKLKDLKAKRVLGGPKALLNPGTPSDAAVAAPKTGGE